MPVKSSSSPVIRWPDRATVEQALGHWAAGIADRHPEVLRIGFFGSYARGDWGVGSDLDVLVIVSDTARPFEQRANDLDASALPVSADVLVYTEAEWQDLLRGSDRFARMIRDEAVWVYVRSS